MTRFHTIAIVVCVLALQSCAHSADKAKQAALERGKRYFQKGSYGDAEIQFRKAIQEDSRFGEAYLWLGRTEKQRNMYDAAVDALRQARTLMPGQDAPAIEVGNVLLVVYFADAKHPPEIYKQIATIADELLARHSDSFEGTRFKAYLAATDGNPAKAVEDFENANRLKPGQADIVTALCESLIRARREDEAESMARGFLAKRPDYGPLYTMLYESYMREKRPQDAEAILKAKVAHNPRESMYRIELARHYARIGDKTAVAQTLDQMVDNAKDFPRGRLDAGDFYAQLRDWTTAKRYYTAGAQNDSSLKLTYWRRLVSADLATGDRGGAQEILDRILKEQPDDQGSRAARASIEMTSSEPEKRKSAIADFRAIVAKSPQSAEYRIQLADALTTSGDLEGALKEYRLVVQRQPGNLAALHALAEISIRRERVDEALGYADRILALQPHNIEASLVRSAALASRQRYAEARAVLVALTTQYPRLREARLQLALLDVAEKRYATAEEGFRKFYEPGKGDVRSLEGLVELYRAQNQLPRAIELLRQDLAKQPGSNEVRNLLAKTAAQAGNYALAAQEYKTLAESQPQSPDVAIQAGLAYQANGDLAGAVGEFQRAARLIPEDGRVYAFLGKAQEDLGQRSEAIGTYRHSLALDDRDPWVMNNLAYLLSETGGNLDEAQKLVETALRQYPSLASFSDTAGWIYYKKGNYRSAVQIFQQVKQKNPGDLECRIHLSLALVATGALAQARSELEAALPLATRSEDKKRIQELLENTSPSPKRSGTTGTSKS